MKHVPPWKTFESRIFNESQLSRITCIQPGQKVQRIGPNRFQEVKGEVDFCLGVDGRFVRLDAKHTIDRIWNLKEYVTHPAKVHQWEKLLTCHSNGNMSGYMIQFSSYGLITWAPTEAIYEHMKKGGLSVHPETKGFSSQSEEIPINFRLLIFGEK